MRSFLPLAALSALVLLPACDTSEDVTIERPAYTVDAAGKLVEFDLLDPQRVRTVGTLTGVASGDAIVGMDFRPSNGTLYALGQSGRLYTINTTTGAATPGAMLMVAGSSVTLAGTSFGVDFNPVPDRLRVVSNTGQNLRINVDTGETTVDGSLAYASGDAGAGTSPQIVAGGYTNSTAGTVTSTQLFVLDAGRNTLVLQNPPNNGTLNTVGALGVDAQAASAFDIFAPTTAYALIQTSTGTELYTVNLTSGAATRVGVLKVSGAVRGMAVPRA